MTAAFIISARTKVSGFIKNILVYNTAWVVFLAGISGLLLLFQLVQLPFILGHDVYFHFHVSEMIANNFPHLPTHIPYYWDSLSFGYPPLFHLLTAALSLLPGFDLLFIYKLVPVFSLVAAILLVHLLYHELSIKHDIIAVCVYVLLLPFHWAMFAGEYPRMLATLFALLMLLTYYKYQNTKKTRFVVFSAVFAGLAMLSNMIAVGIIGVFLLYESLRVWTEDKSIIPLFVGIGAIIVASPWVIRTIYLFGYSYLLRVLQVHQSAINPVFVPLGIGIFAFMYAKITKKLPHGLWIWFLVAFLWAKLSFWTIATGFLIARGIAPIISRFLEKYSLSVQAVIVSLALLLISVTTSGRYIYMDEYLNNDVFSAAEWIQDNTPADAKLLAFLSVPSTSVDVINILVDSLTGVTRDENLPYFTKRQTYTWFGYEWNTDSAQLDAYNAIQSKACAQEFVANAIELDIEPNYLWINKDSPDYTNTDVYCDDFDEPQFVTVYENESILIKKVEHIKRCNCLADGLYEQ